MTRIQVMVFYLDTLFIVRHYSWRDVLSGDIVHSVVFYLETLFMVWCFIWRHYSCRGVLSGDIVHGVVFYLQMFKTLCHEQCHQIKHHAMIQVMVFYLESPATFYEYNTIQLNRTPE
ncbi:hypothetical protein Hanom_Chr05g00435681 [Helianthus anomalus]